MFQPAGRTMCTTACLHFAVAIISKRMNIALDTSSENEACRLKREIENIMRLSSCCHGQRGMISVYEALKNVDLKQLGIKAEEYMFFEMKDRNNNYAQNQDAGDGCCFFSMQQFPQILLNKSSSGSNESACAIVTCNNHSVLAACYSCCNHGAKKPNCSSSSRTQKMHMNDGNSCRFAFFDPMPSKLVTNISRHHAEVALRKLIAEALNMNSRKFQQIDVTFISFQ